MPGIAKERGVTFATAAAAERAVSSHATSQDFRARLDSATRALDGIGGLGWAVIGFVVGAVCWHFIGFWGFMANVVLAGGPQTDADRAMLSARAERTGLQRVAGWASADTSRCTTLVIARRSGVTLSKPCADGFAALPHDRQQVREDRLVAAAADSRP